MKNPYYKLSLALLTATTLFTGCLNNATDDTADFAAPTQENVNADMNSLTKEGLTQKDLLGSAFPTIEGSFAPTSSVSLASSPTSTTSLKKRSANPGVKDSIAVDTSHIDEGYALVTFFQIELLSSTTSKAWVEWDEFAQDDIDDNENIRRFESVRTFANGTSESVNIEDADGDGIANGEAKYANRVKLTFSKTGLLGVTETAIMTVDAGPDHDFGKEGNPAERDNLMISMKWEKTLNDEVIAYGHFKDGDGDGILVDPSFKTPSLVEVEMYESKNLLKPLVKSSKLNLTIKMKEVDTEGEIISISGIETFNSGKVNTVTAVDADGSEVLDPGDIVTVTLLSESPITSDSNLVKEVKFVLDIGSGMQDSTDNQLIEIHVRSDKRFGIVASEEFHFKSDEPIPHGQEPTSGAIGIRVTYRNGSSATLEGNFAEGKVDGTITGPAGNTVSFNWQE